MFGSACLCLQLALAVNSRLGWSSVPPCCFESTMPGSDQAVGRRVVVSRHLHKREEQSIVLMPGKRTIRTRTRTRTRKVWCHRIIGVLAKFQGTGQAEKSWGKRD